MTEIDFSPIVPPKNTNQENGFNPVVPPLKTDFNGGSTELTKPQVSVIGNSEKLTADIEDKMDLKPGEFTADPSDPDYKPAFTRKDKWDRFKETGEI